MTLVCTPNGHQYRVTYTRCHIDTIHSPDDGQKHAENRNKHTRKRIVSQVGYLQRLFTNISIAVVFTVRSLQEFMEWTQMHVRLLCAFYLRKFSTSRGEICFGVALNTLEEIPSHSSSRICSYYEVCTLSIAFFCSSFSQGKKYILHKY
jgi:hypothetical protein